jgi:hypothetical protein
MFCCCLGRSLKYKKIENTHENKKNISQNQYQNVITTNIITKNKETEIHTSSPDYYNQYQFHPNSTKIKKR